MDAAARQHRPGTPSGLGGVICDDLDARCRSVAGLLSRSGFTVVDQVPTFAALRDSVLGCRPAVAVLALSLVGMGGLEAVRVLRRDVPDCQVVLLSSFSRLVPEAVQAGARALVPEDDPQALLDVLRAVAAGHHRVLQAQLVSS